MDSSLLSRFAAIVGANNALTDPNDTISYRRDDRGLYQGKTPLVLRPGSTEEVAAIMTLAYENGIAVVPQGGLTGLVGGHVPDESNTEIVVSLQRMNRIRELDAAANWAIVEAGLTLEALQNAASEAGRMFPFNIGSKGSCTIGGNLATNAGGTQAIAYGVMRDLVLGLEVVLPDGRVWHGLRTLKKDNTGYDLRHLFVGAEGTLGIITAAAVKLAPALPTVETAWVGVEDPAMALKLLQFTQGKFGQAVTGFEIMPRNLFEFVLKHLNGARDPLETACPWYVLVEVGAEGLIDALGEAFEEGLALDAAVAQTLEQAKQFWHMRESMSEVQKHEGGSIKHDVSVPVSAVPAFIAEATVAVEDFMPGVRVVAFGHLGDGNIHFNVSQPVGVDKEAYLQKWHAMNEIVHRIVHRMKGSISAEHGIGQLKRELLQEVKDPVEYQLMKDIKKLLDPKGLMNPGKVL